MVADLARVSYDPTREYRSLVYQQGRVTLEADNNEAEMLQAEALRLETIDIVGPSGTPDNGYAVSSGAGPGGVVVGKGSFYLGGWRLELDKPVDLSKQPDWVDAPAFTIAQGNLAVALLVTEQSVCANEDQALRDVALGGPDSAARTRLMQRFLRLQTNGDTCPAAASSVAALLKADGVKVDPYSLQLISTARLRVGFTPGPKNTDPCQPTAAGGYLGADNQLVRVTVTQYDPTKRSGKFLWGWNNASLLYRATATDPFTLTLQNIPVDQEHAPQTKQFVEILRTTCKLGDNNFIADGEGFVVAIAQPWSPDTGEIVLATQLPPAYQNNTDPLFVRLWQAEIDFDDGKPAPLDTTSGLTVEITMEGAVPSHIAARPVWRFAVRPAMPQAIFPQRYQEGLQPPDGPRQWITDLAVVSAQAQGSTLLADCRVPFLPLTQQKGGCCGVVMGPTDVAGAGGLQAVVDSLAASAAILSLRTGDYPLSAPLKLTAKHAGLTIEGCNDGVRLQAAGADLTPFRLGLVTLEAVTDVTLRQLEFDMPLVALGKQEKAQVGTLCGVTVVSAKGLTIESCRFTTEVKSLYAFGVELLVGGAASHVTLTQNVFTAPSGGPELFGVLALTTESVNAKLDQWSISDNQFENLLCGVFGYAKLGLIRCDDNVVTGSQGGFIFAEANLGDTATFTQEALQREARELAAGAGGTSVGASANAALRPDLLAGWTQKVAPIASALPAPTASKVSTVARDALARQTESAGSALYEKFVQTNTTIATDAATRAATDTTPAANAAGAAPTQASTAETTPASADFETIKAISVAVELTEAALTPALRIEDNEITLTAGATPPSLGIDVILSRREPGTVIVSGNRVVAPDSSTVACGLLLPAAAVVTGNLLMQLREARDEKTDTQYCLILLTESTSIMVSANVVRFREHILPARATQASTQTWEFLETTG